MTQSHIVGHATQHTSTQQSGGVIRRAGAALAAWSAGRSERRAIRRAERGPRLGILDPDAPRAVRANGFPPGIFR